MARASLDKDPQHVAAMFDDIARRYDITNGVLSFGQDRRWRKEVLKALQITPGDRVLDLAAGTGVSSVALHEAGAEVIPCDFSVGMLTQGMRQRPGLPYIAGDATALPFADATFDAVTISFGLRNVVETETALKEMRRVTKPGGRIVICEFSTPTWGPFREVYEQYLMRALPKVAGLVTKEGSSYEYLAESITAWPDQEGLGRLMLASGWEKVGFRNLSGGIVALHRGTVPTAG